jgi:hypothetical protein
MIQPINCGCLRLRNSSVRQNQRRAHHAADAGNVIADCATLFVTETCSGTALIFASWANDGIASAPARRMGENVFMRQCLPARREISKQICCGISFNHGQALRGAAANKGALVCAKRQPQQVDKAAAGLRHSRAVRLWALPTSLFRHFNCGFHFEVRV